MKWNVSKTIKEQEKKKNEEFNKLNEDILSKFIQFQIDNNARAFIVNAGSSDFIVNLIMQFASLKWRPMEEKEKEQLQIELAKASGIIVAKK